MAKSKSDTEPAMPVHAFETPRLRSLLRKGLPAIIESTLVPLAIFYAALWAVGMWGALIAALAWSYLAIVRRLVKKEPIPGLAILGALALTFRTALAMVTGNVLLYFLQPSLGTALVGLAFLVSMRTDRPLIQRLARDFLPVPPGFFEQPSVRRFFSRISPLWALMMLINAAATIWMLFALPVSLFVISRTLVSGALIAATMAYSVMGLRRLLSGGPARATTSRPRRLVVRRPQPRIIVPVWGVNPPVRHAVTHRKKGEVGRLLPTLPRPYLVSTVEKGVQDVRIYQARLHGTVGRVGCRPPLALYHGVAVDPGSGWVFRHGDRRRSHGSG